MVCVCLRWWSFWTGGTFCLWSFSRFDPSGSVMAKQTASTDSFFYVFNVNTAFVLPMANSPHNVWWKNSIRYAGALNSAARTVSDPSTTYLHTITVNHCACCSGLSYLLDCTSEGIWTVRTSDAPLAVWATVNILDWKLVLKMELSVGCLQQPTAITSSHDAR